MFTVGVCPHFSKTFLSLFQRTARVVYSPLGPFKVKYGVALNDRMMVYPGGGGGTPVAQNKIAPGYPV